VFSDSYNILLPIKPKPLLYPKDLTLMSDSRHSSKTDQLIGDAILVGSFFLVLFVIYSSKKQEKNNFSQREIKQLSGTYLIGS
jgi:hypothetical protein